jgi:protein-tyrosine phosphatase
VEKAGLAERIETASAGTGGWHIGDPPHPGTLGVLRRRGIDASAQRARKLARADAQAYDYIIAMDGENVEDAAHVLGLREARGRGQGASAVGAPIRRLMEFAPPGWPQDVPDPYYTGTFEQVYEMVQAGCMGLLAAIRQEHGL